MGIWAHRHFFPHLAVVLVTLFVSVLFMHALIPHHHDEYEAFGAGILLPVHNATGEKFFSIILPPSLFVAFSTILFANTRFPGMRLYARRQQSDESLLDPYQLLFARGILHSKAY